MEVSLRQQWHHRKRNDREDNKKIVYSFHCRGHDSANMVQNFKPNELDQPKSFFDNPAGGLLS